jgi:hypothetical protein
MKCSKAPLFETGAWMTSFFSFPYIVNERRNTGGLRVVDPIFINIRKTIPNNYS